jgi:hypothetical protein
LSPISPLVLEAVIDCYWPLAVTAPAQVEAALGEQQRSLLRRQALKALSSLRLRDPFAALQALEIETRQQEVERQTGAGEQRDLLLQSVQALFDSLGEVWRAPREELPGVLGVMQGHTVVPRSRDLLEAVVKGPEEWLARNKDKKFPPPPEPTGARSRNVSHLPRGGCRSCARSNRLTRAVALDMRRR